MLSVCCTFISSKIVTVPPEWKTTPPSSLRVKEGSDVSIECSATGEPKPSVTLLREKGMVLVALRAEDVKYPLWFLWLDSRWIQLSLLEGSVLPRVATSATGHYKCRADNGVGTPVETSFHLSVLGMPVHAFSLFFSLVLPATGLSLSTSLKMRRFSNVHVTQLLAIPPAIGCQPPPHVWDALFYRYFCSLLQFADDSASVYLWVYWTLYAECNCRFQRSRRSSDFNFPTMWKWMATQWSPVLLSLVHHRFNSNGSRTRCLSNKVTLSPPWPMISSQVSLFVNWLVTMQAITLASWRTARVLILKLYRCSSTVSQEAVTFYPLLTRTIFILYSCTRMDEETETCRKGHYRKRFADWMLRYRWTTSVIVYR